MSVVLAAFLAAWAIGQYRISAEPGYLAAGVAAIASALALAAYGTAFQKKTRGL
jgi:hypothetical protein